MSDGTNAGAAAPVGTTAAPVQTPAAQPTASQPSNPQTPTPQPSGGSNDQAKPVQDGQQQPAAVDPAKLPDGQQNAPATEFKLPDEYKDKPWASKVKSMDDLYKQIDTLDALKGKKTIIPDLKTATPEEREAYYAQTRPADASAYQFADDLNGFPISPETKAGVGKIFLDNGISEVQGNAVIQAYNEMGKAQIAKMFDANDLKAEMTKQFGPEGEQMIAKTRNTIKGMMTPEDAAMLDNLPNNYLGIIYRTLGNTIKSFGVKETDTAHFGGTGNAGGGQDIGQVRASIRAEIANLPNQPHTTDQANALRQKLADTYKADPRIQR